MALSETANLVVKLSLGGNFTSQIGKATAGLGKLEKGSNRAYRAGQQIGTGIKNVGKLAVVGVGLLTTQVALGLDSLIKLESMTAQTEAVLKSTGGVAGVTAGQVRKLAEQFESLNATVGDETIQNAENLLLTFTKINKDAFEPTLKAALDMNQALGGGPDGLAGNAKLLGKALQDPEKGLSRLGRAVGGFSDETVKAVKEALKNNDTLKAQNIILAELEKRYGGSFARAGNTTAGSVAKFGDAIEDLQRSLATALLPTVRNVADALTDFLADDEVKKGAEELGASIAKVFSKDNIKSGIGALGTVISTIRGAMPAIVSAASAIGSVVGTAVNLFNTLPPELKTLLVAGVGVNKLTGGLVTNVAGGIVGAILGQLRSAVVNVQGAVVNVAGAGALPGVGGAAAAAGSAGISTIGKLFLVGEAIGLVAAVNQVRDSIRSDATRQAEGVSAQARAFVESDRRTTAELKNALAGVEQGIRELEADPLAVALVTGPALDELRRTRLAIQNQLAAKIEVTNNRTTTAIESMKGKLAGDLARNKAATDEAKRATAIGAALGAATTRFSAAANASTISATIRANRPIITTIVNVTANSYTKTVEVSQRYGSPNGSRNQGNTNEGGMGGH